MSTFLQNLANNEIVQGILVLVVIGILTKLLPKVGDLLKNLYKKWITHKINKCVKKAEKKFSDPKMGDKKKSYVLSQTQKYNARLITMNTNIDSVIEECVSILNAKNDSVKESLKTNATELVEDTTTSLKVGISETIQSALINK